MLLPAAFGSPQPRRKPTTTYAVYIDFCKLLFIWLKTCYYAVSFW